MSTWPVTLPQYPLISNHSTKLQTQSIRSKMDIGPAKVRRRFSAGTSDWSCSIIVPTVAILDVFNDFYLNTLQGGSLTFDWAYFTNAVRFKNTPDVKPITPVSYRITFIIEEMP